MKHVILGSHADKDWILVVFVYSLSQKRWQAVKTNSPFLLLVFKHVVEVLLSVLRTFTALILKYWLPPTVYEHTYHCSQNRRTNKETNEHLLDICGLTTVITMSHTRKRINVFVIGSPWNCCLKPSSLYTNNLSNVYKCSIYYYSCNEYLPACRFKSLSLQRILLFHYLKGNTNSNMKLHGMTDKIWQQWRHFTLHDLVLYCLLS